MGSIRVFIEVGQKKVFVGAVDWPGWCHWGTDEALAFETLIAYGPRYAQVLAGCGLEFQPLNAVEGFTVIERHPGSRTTDFGAPDAVLDIDQTPLIEAEYQRAVKIFQASWDALDRVVAQADGKELRKGPRGGGRDLEKIGFHLLQADQAYLRRLARSVRVDEHGDPFCQMVAMRQEILAGLQTGMDGEIPEEGPRGGKIWPLRYYIRRTVWHTLDHVWEIEDRMI
jgi:hypothetical protein